MITLKEYKELMKNIAVGDHIMFTDNRDDERFHEVRTVTGFNECRHKRNKQAFTNICNFCIGYIGLDGDEPKCHSYSDPQHENDVVMCDIEKCVLMDFLDEDEFEI